MYRKTKKYSRQQRMGEHDPEDRPRDLPHLRKIILVIDFDFGISSHLFKLYKTNRVDCYRVEVDGKPWMSRIGFSRILDKLRLAMPRVKGARNL